MSGPLAVFLIALFVFAMLFIGAAVWADAVSKDWYR